MQAKVEDTVFVGFSDSSFKKKGDISMQVVSNGSDNHSGSRLSPKTSTYEIIISYRKEIPQITFYKVWNHTRRNVLAQPTLSLFLLEPAMVFETSEKSGDT